MKTSKQPIPSVVYRAQEAVIAVSQGLPVGTNLRIHDALLTIMSGGLLQSRGAIIPALSEKGLSQNEVLRTREAIQSGSWSVAGLLKRWQEWVSTEGKWQGLEVGGYKVKAMDTIGIYRPRLKGCETKHYQSTAGKALAAKNFGVMSAIGRIETQKVSLAQVLVRGDEIAQSEEGLIQRLCEQSSKLLGKGDVVTADRKFPVLVMLEAGIKQVVLRRATNFTVRRVLDTQKPQNQVAKLGRPRKPGELIRPLPRTHKGKVLPASKPEEIQCWKNSQGQLLEARIWRKVVLSQQKHWREEQKALNAGQHWSVITVKHPDFELPMVLLLNLNLSPPQAYSVIQGRWGVEQMPLVSKQLLGGHRMFVFEREMCFRLPELTFLAANILISVAASCEPMPTGWWDTQPKPTAGRLRRAFCKLHDLRVLDLPIQLRKKNSATAHLPLGWHSAIKKGRGVSET